MERTHKPTILTPGDAHVLDQIFDPESSPDAATVRIDPSLPSDPHIANPELLKALRKEELEAIRLIEEHQLSTTTPRLSPSGPNSPPPQPDHAVYEQALSKLSALIEQHPAYASAYNNRAQVRRWRYGMGGPASAITSQDTSSEAANALALSLTDLATAISLASPPPNAAVSPPQGRLLAQAWTQKGAVLLALSRSAGGQRVDASSTSTGSDVQEGADWRSWDRMTFEEESSRCFFMAGLYGSEVGRSMAVRANPYARLCAGIVREALVREGR